MKDHDEEQARKAKAAKLRKEIEAITGGAEKSSPPVVTPGTPPNENPRDFIQRRMHEPDQSGEE